MVGNRKIMLISLLSLAAMILVLFLMSLESQAAEIPIDGAPSGDIATGESCPLSDPANCTVTRTADDGSSGTLRWCLSEAEAGDIITFHSSAFPATITLDKGRGRLPDIDKGNITIDGSGAGVIIDGSQLTSVYDDGFRITSNNNTIIGITIQNFPGDGVDIRDGAQGNRIENCVIRGNGRGGTERRGVRVDGNGTTGNTITRNSITDNDGPGIITTNGGNAELAPPIINSVVTTTHAITVTGFALPGVTVELFTDPGGEGANFLDSTAADSKGRFTKVVTGVTLGDDNVTATATDASGNTSMFTCYPIPIPSLVWPLSGTTTPDGPFSSPFGPRLKASEDYRYDWHRGIDIPTSTGTTAYAVANGTVRCAGKCSGYSDPIIVQLEHEDGCYYCNYLHMLTNTVKTGDTVNQGEEVGTTGTSASGFEHLHFEIRRGGYYQRNAVNPFVYLPYTDDPFGHTAIISGVYVHTASVTPTVIARVVVTAPANELDFNRLALTVTDSEGQRDWRVADFHVFNIQKSTIEHPEVLDNPYVDDICIMPARFNTTTQEYRIDFVFYGLKGSNSITLTAEAADVHSHVVSTSTSKTAGGVTISPSQVISSAWPGTTITYTHILSNESGITPTLKLDASSAQSWTVQVSPPSITLPDQSEIKVSITVPTNTCGITDCTAVTAADVTGTIQVIAVDVTNVPCPSFLPVIMKNYHP